MPVSFLFGDCLLEMGKVPDSSIDAVITDPPYGTTQCKWDSEIPFEPMWAQLKRVIKPNGAIVLFGSEPFSSALRMSNIKMYKYDWIWVKDKATNHLNCKRMPVRKVEKISIFYNKQCTYNPQLHDKHPKDIRPPTVSRPNAENYGKMDKVSTRTIPVDKGYPCEILRFGACFGGGVSTVHPTQKPIALMEYLIKTYTDEGGTVLDFTMGSGTTGVACQNTGRSFIGIENDMEYFLAAAGRVNRAIEKGA